MALRHGSKDRAQRGPFCYAECRCAACVSQATTIHNGDGDVTKEKVSKKNNGCARVLEIVIQVTALID